MRNVWLDDGPREPASSHDDDPLQTVIARLASAIDATGESDAHIRRMTAYAIGLGRAVGLPADAIEDLRLAAMLHDIGYLGIAQHLLQKPGPLSPDEMAIVAIHPQIGVDILGGVPVGSTVRAAVLGHHERWDGGGYPQGLRGDAIPVAARILAIVDCFDALTRDRPHRGRIGVEAALRVIREESGHAFEPRLVEAFVEICPLLVRELAERDDGAADDRERMRREALRGIGRATDELYALHRLTSRLGPANSVRSVMETVDDELRRLVPFSSCALYVMDARTRQVRCAWAAGPAADALRSWNGAPEWEPGRPEGCPEELRTGTLLIQSLRTGDHPVGTLVLPQQDACPGTDDHRRLLESTRASVAAAVARSLAYEQALQTAITDAATGLPTPRYLWLHLARELGRARRARSDVGVIALTVGGLDAQAAQA
ncbi:MAG: HD domain-containing phosphohydrolase, partial [Vicinamibacterales bacterium]